ncbi:hypothetical protein [Euzebya sp.]|uniref:hypothetical protein n=1 Tax=Euzebya sp. TaxID=1971409 RepID=UPI0035135ADE
MAPDPRRPARRVPLTAVLVLVVLVTALAGCTGDDGAAAADLTAHERDEFTFGTPSGWEVRTDEPEEIEVVGTDQVGDSIEAVTGKVGNYEGDGVRLAAQGALDVFRVAVDDHEFTDERDVDVTGADEGILFESTYASATLDERIRQWDVFATAEGSSRVVYLSLKAPESIFDETEMTAVLDSLEVTL